MLAAQGCRQPWLQPTLVELRALATHTAADELVKYGSRWPAVRMQPQGKHNSTAAQQQQDMHSKKNFSAVQMDMHGKKRTAGHGPAAAARQRRQSPPTHLSDEVCAVV